MLNPFKLILYMLLSLLAPLLSRARYIDLYSVGPFLRRIRKMIKITNEQMVTLHAQPKTAAGLPALVDGPLTWSVSDPSLATLTVSEDTFSCVVTSTDLTGTVTVTVEGDADLTEGTLIISGTFDIEIVPAIAAFIEITADPAELKF